MLLFKRRHSAGGSSVFSRTDGEHQFADPQRDFFFGTLKDRQIDPTGTVFPGFGNQFPAEQKRAEAAAAVIGGYLQKPCGKPAKLVLRKKNMPGGYGGLLKHVFYRAADAVFTVRGDAESGADPVRGAETDPVQT